jgi:hypothetical protein
LFLIEGFANSGTVTYTASATGLGSVTGSITLVPAALGIQPLPPAGTIGQSSFTAYSSEGTATLTIWTGYFANGNFVAQNLTSGSLTITLSSSNTSVANVSQSPITITAGNDSANSGLTPVSSTTAGNTTVTVTAPGFTSAVIGATFSNQQQALLLSGDSNLANGLELPYTVSIPNNAPAGGQAIVLTSNSGSILFSTTAAGTGSASLTVTIPANASSLTFYVQGTAASGSATITAAATGYTSATASLTLHPAAVVIAPFGGGSPNTPGSVPLFFAWLDSSGTPNIDQYQTPKALSVSLSTSNSSVAPVSSPLSIPAGNNAGSVPINFGSAGSATIPITQQPSGFGTPNTDTSSSITVQ